MQKQPSEETQRTAIFAEWRYAVYDEGEEKRLVIFDILNPFFQMQILFHDRIHRECCQQTRDP